MRKILLMVLSLGILSQAGIVFAREVFFDPGGLPQYVLPGKEERLPESREIARIEKERRNPNKEAELFAKLIERLFSEITPEELEKIKLDKRNFLLTYLRNKTHLIDFREKPLEEEEIFEVFQKNLTLWSAELLRLYYEVNKIKIKESFADFLERLYEEKRVSAEVAFFAGLVGKENKEFMEKVFSRLPREEKIILKVEKEGKNLQQSKFYLKEIGPENILKKMSRDVSRKESPVRKLFLGIEVGKGMKFLGLLVSTLGTVLVSPRGIFFERNFPPAGEFSLAEFLKMVVKTISVVMPYLALPPKPLPSAGREDYFYLRYILVILCFWLFLKRMEKINWNPLYLEIEKPVRDFFSRSGELISRGRNKLREEKERTIRLLVKVKPRMSLPKPAGIRPPKHLENRIKELEEIEKRLKRTKHWARYLTNLQK
ncbi:MAG: hypothetical protein NC920_03695 [Candidatus Omnitrophica bacterium]|nr:hypothetical protein [Candidatus Omnitrophota bacterium]